ncbi:transposable element tcb2 transposase [Trichonephila clavipes]|nr:transposable element tcb2 transposase [Trichonephila clavipes]
MGPLIRLDTTLTDDRYVSIMYDHLHPFISNVHSEEFEEFQQDNATPHTSKILTEWLQDHSSKFRHFRWPLKSPDVNIIEYIWNALQRAVQDISPPPLTDLLTALQDSWRQLPPALLQTLIKSMPRHVGDFCVFMGPYTILGRRRIQPAQKAHQTLSSSGCNGVSTYKNNSCGLASLQMRAVLFVDVAIQPEVLFIAKQNSLMKIGNNGNLVWAHSTNLRLA